MEAFSNLYLINSERKQKEYVNKIFQTLSPFPNYKCVYFKTSMKHFINFTNSVSAMGLKLKGKQGAVMRSPVQSGSLNGSLTLPQRHALGEISVFSPATALTATITAQISKQTVVPLSQAGNTTALAFLHRIFLEYSTTAARGALSTQPLTFLPPCHRAQIAKNDPSCNSY